MIGSEPVKSAEFQCTLEPVTGEASHAFSTLCMEHGFPADVLECVDALAHDISESARAILRGQTEKIQVLQPLRTTPIPGRRSDRVDRGSR